MRATELTRLRLLNSTDGSALSSLSFDASSQCLQITSLSTKQRAYSYGTGPRGSVHLCSDELTELYGLYLLLLRPSVVTLSLQRARDRLPLPDDLKPAVSAVEFLFVVEGAAMSDQQARAAFELCTKKHLGFVVRINDYRHFFFSNVPSMLQTSLLPLMSLVDATTTVASVMKDPAGVLTFGRVLENVIDQSANHSTAATRASYGTRLTLCEPFI